MIVAIVVHALQSVPTRPVLDYHAKQIKTFVLWIIEGRVEMFAFMGYNFKNNFTMYRDWEMPIALLRLRNR